ncbi:6-carboxytetrahydropterin synthase [Streptomyces sp. PT12]|uniref:6-pyruvoyl trahydropterin synthase family protein n=1 Tax=Streptomyces sp. PT12 TaxID=1510197 RepID=UPI001C667B72|nr:6-carboxytetrahydropterin synthase [Streptomyces sp. PT12]
MSGVAGRFRIGKRFRFEAAHRLTGLPEGHQCGRLHGHSYTAEIILAAEQLDGRGFVTDFGDLAPVRTFIDERLDHQLLNEVLPISPTSENLARFLAEWFIEHVAPGIRGRLERVRVSEAASSWAEFEVIR